MKNRLAVYFFHDNDGIADGYAVFFLQALKRISSKVCCVAGGKIGEGSRKELEACTDEIIVCDEKADAASAYAGFVNRRYDEIVSFEELILCNDSVFGPLYPLEDVFSEMEIRAERPDFWGITTEPFLETASSRDSGGQDSSAKERIESYFAVFSRKAVQSPAFAKFSEDYPKYSKDSIAVYESGLTDALSGAGLTYGSYADCSGLPRSDRMILCPDVMVRDRRCPFVKKEAFTAPYEKFFAAGGGNSSRKCLEFIKERMGYSTDLIWEHLLRTQRMSALRQNLGLNYILDSERSGQLINPRRKTALLCYVYYPENIEACLSYAGNAAGTADLYFASSREDTLEAAKKYLDDSAFSSVRFIKKRNKGRDVSAYLIDCASLFDSYDYLCFIHDKKSPHLDSRLMTQNFFRMCIGRMLCSRSYVTNILNLFESHPRLGLAVMPPLCFGQFYVSDFRMSDGNHEHMLELMRMLDLNVPFDSSPVAPYGDMFWCRTAAFRKLFSRSWTYDDLPDEPVPPDGTLLHAIERIHPLAAQASGFYSAWVHPAGEAENYMNHLYYIDRTLNERLYSACGYATTLPEMVNNIWNCKSVSSSACDERAAEELKARYDSSASDSHGAEILLSAESSSVLMSLSMPELIRLKFRRFLYERRLKKESGKLIEFFSGKADLWDPEYYLEQYPEAAWAGCTPLLHYISYGWKRNLNPSGKCRTEDYLIANPDCLLLGISPLEHYYLNCKSRMIFRSMDELSEYSAGHGAEILKMSSRFDPEFYRKRCIEKNGSLPEGFEPYSYYLEHGVYESVKPCAHFRVHKYLDRFPEIRRYGICPVVHYELTGKYM